MTTGPVSAADITAAVREAGLAGRPVCGHSSLRSFGRVVGGPDAVVRGLLDAGTTLLVPTSSFRFCRAPRPPGRPPRPYNSEDDGSIPDPGAAPLAGFDVTANFVDPAMGAIPAAVLRDPRRVRGNHPLNSFTAIGPQARELVDGQTATDVYAPLAGLVARGGAVVCMGVGLDAVTLLHLAEARAGLRLLHRWGMQSDGAVVDAVHGGCSRGFERLADVAGPAERECFVGPSRWRIFDAAAILTLATERFRADPGAGLCDTPGCIRCRDQMAYAAAKPCPTQ